MINGEYSIVITTYPDKESAKRVSKLLVEKRLAACVHAIPIESVYFWQGEVCEDKEIVLLIKSKTVLFNKIAETIKENHPYEVPEIIQTPITDGSPDYLKWIGECV